ncbi:hypothetical protein BH09GEM1_BH09GEM1_48410 [soil metagenome]
MAVNADEAAQGIEDAAVVMLVLLVYGTFEPDLVAAQVWCEAVVEMPATLTCDAHDHATQPTRGHTVAVALP